MLTDIGRSLTTTISNLFRTPVTSSSIDTTIRDVCTTLLHANVHPNTVYNLRNSLRTTLTDIPAGVSKARFVASTITDSIIEILTPHKKSYNIVKKKCNIVVFVGLQGCGKTTTVCKYANYHVKKGLKTGIVCADTFRAGAFDQVKQNALKIKVPFYGSSETDPVVVAKLGVERFKKDNFDLILVDTSGRNTQESELFCEMKEIIQQINPSNIIFVMDAGIGQSAEEQARGFAESVDVGGIILTKLDGTAKAGGALASVAATQCPIEFIGTGEGMDDFEVFEPKRFVNKLLGRGDVEGLFEKVSDLKIDEKAMMKKLEKGEFFLKDFYDQFQQLMSLGPLSKLLEMVPGMSGFNISEDSIKKMVCIFDSMAKNELNSNGQCFENESRVIRVAKGSGTSIQMVYDIIRQYGLISSMMKKMGKIPGMGDLIGKDPSKMSLQDKAKMKNQMKGVLPKGMFDQFSQFFQ